MHPALALTLFLTAPSLAAQLTPLSLELHLPTDGKPFTLTSSPHPDTVVTLESPSNPPWPGFVI
jgi:hypothetical protein